MRDKLIQYVQLLFAGAPDSEDMKQEILQNTLDRYDDLIAEGRSPETAYRMAIKGIGDVNDILSGVPQGRPCPEAPIKTKDDGDTPTKKMLRAIAIALYILCPIPLILLSEMGMDVVGVCCLLAIVAVATALIMMGAKKEPEEPDYSDSRPMGPREELQKSINTVIWVVGVAAYLLISFRTHAWYITWLIFPLIGAVQGLIRAILDLKEEKNHEA